MENEFRLAIEGGGTKTRLLLAAPNGTVLAHEIGPPASPLYIDPKKYSQEISSLLERIRAILRDNNARIVAVALAAPMNVDLIKRLIERFFGEVKVIRFRESDAALGYYNLREGCALIAGTGSSCYVHTPDGSTVMGGGLGPQFGDEGSAYWLGKEAIASVLRATQATGEQSRLAKSMLRHFGIEKPHDILQFTYGNGFMSASKIAGFAKEVFALAKENDGDAIALCSRAGSELGKLVADTMARAGVEEIPLVCSGGVFHGGAFITDPLQAFLKQHNIRYIWMSPLLEPVEGLLRALTNTLEKGESHVS